MATAALAFDSIPSLDLDAVTGGFDWGRMVDNGNRYGTAGGLVGAGVGAGVGSLAAGVGAVPGAGVGGAIGGVGGWVGGAAYDAYQQYKGR
jgi:hypothetical protein